MKIKPLFDRIILKEIPEGESISKGGILIPASAKERPILAEVIECGTGGKLDGNEIEIVVKKGEKVLVHKYATSEFHINGENLLLIKQDDILAKIED